MAVERADLWVGLNVDHTSPVSSTPPVQGRKSPGERQEKQQRRPPPESEPPPEAGDAAEDLPPHKIDSLA